MAVKADADQVGARTRSKPLGSNIQAIRHVWTISAGMSKKKQKDYVNKLRATDISTAPQMTSQTGKGRQLKVKRSIHRYKLYVAYMALAYPKTTNRGVFDVCRLIVATIINFALR